MIVCLKGTENKKHLELMALLLYLNLLFGCGVEITGKI
jgi:hypothetical protein